MKRRLFNILAAASLVLCALVITVWTNGEKFIVWRPEPGHWIQVIPENGWLGVGYIVGVFEYGGEHWYLADGWWFPMWLAPVFLIIPSIWLHLFWRRRRTLARIRMNVCDCCGYDLRASADRCPECGTAIPTPSASNFIQARPSKEPL